MKRSAPPTDASQHAGWTMSLFWAASPVRRGLSATALLFACLTFRPSGAEGENPRGKGGPTPKETEPGPPSRVALPRAGEYPAEEILALAGKLHGRVVRLESERVRETKVEVSKELGGTQVSEEELTVLLAAHQLYLFPITDPKEGKILVVSRNPQWKEEPPRFTKIIQAPSKGFGETWAGIERAVNERNANLPKGIEPVVAVPSARTGKIFLRAGRTEDLDAIEKAAEAFLEKKGEKDSNRPRLYTYQGHYRAAKALEAEVLEKLDEGERDRLRFVISSKGNRLLYRCPALLAEKVEKLLKELDKPEQKKSEEHQKKS